MRFIYWQRTHTNCSTNEGRWVPNVAQTFLLDEVCHCWREVLIVSLYIVLQNQTTERPCWLVCKRIKNTRVNNKVAITKTMGTHEEEDKHNNACERKRKTENRKKWGDEEEQGL